MENTNTTTSTVTPTMDKIIAALGELPEEPEPSTIRLSRQTFDQLKVEMVPGRDFNPDHLRAPGTPPVFGLRVEFDDKIPLGEIEVK
jgi:hypothetical protein